MAPSRLANIVNKINRWPEAVRSLGLTTAFIAQVKFAGTAGLAIKELSSTKSVVTLKNRRRVQNHIGGVHAAATALAAETASGIVFGMNVPSDRLPLLKSMNIQYLKRSKGRITAVSTLSEEEIQKILATEKGSLIVPTTVTDEESKETVACEMEWAWIPKK